MLKGPDLLLVVGQAGLSVYAFEDRLCRRASFACPEHQTWLLTHHMM